MNENVMASTDGQQSVLSKLGTACQALPSSADTLLTVASSQESALANSTDFIENDLIEQATAQISAQSIRIEAEDLTLDGYRVEKINERREVSNNQLISLRGSKRRESQRRVGTATGQFEGEAGFYDVVVGYYDESDGISDVNVTVAGEQTAFKLDELLGRVWVGPKNAVTKVTHEAIALKSGDTFELKGLAEGGEYARFDYVEFVRVEVPQTPDGPPDGPATPDSPLPNNTSADGTRSPLYTDSTKLPNGPNDYAFVSNREQIAYISDDTSSMIHFQVGTPAPTFSTNPATGQQEKTGTTPTPELRFHLPEGIEIQSGIRDIKVERWNYKPKINGEQFTNSWRVLPGNNASKFTLTWKADAAQNWSEGDQLKGYYWGASPENGGGKQRFQEFNIEVVDVPETEPFETIPVWLSLPSDLIETWPDTTDETPERGTNIADTDSFSRIGVNQMDIWSYFWEGGLKEGTTDPALTSGKSLEAVRKKLEQSEIDPIPWARDVWWREAAKQEASSRSVNQNGEFMDIDGKLASDVKNTKYSLRLTYNDDNNGKGGAYFQAWIKQGKELIDRGLYLHSFDPEMYRNGESIGYDNQTIAAFKTYYEEKATAGEVTEAYVDPKTLATSSPEEWTEVKDTWEEFKAYRYTKFFSDYREAMEAHMDSKGIDRTQTPFEMKALTTYHRQWEGFTGFEDDYTESPVYKKTLEDPKMLAEVFDYISPMTYTGIYANGAGTTVENGDYNMKQTWEDTYSIDQLVKGSGLGTEVTPILSAGYPFAKGFEADVSPEMLKENILESIIAGGYGFGIWGETPIDAKDMKMISESVSMLRPYEDILLSGRQSDKISVEGNNAFVHRLDGDKGSLILVSDYSDETKPVTVKVTAPQFSPQSIVVVDLDNPEANLSFTATSENTIQFDSELSTGARVKVFYVGPRR